jgi:hypothetical protein
MPKKPTIRRRAMASKCSGASGLAVYGNWNPARSFEAIGIATTA